MKSLLNILNVVNQPLKRTDYNIQNSKHSPVYRKRDVEGFASLFSFIFVNLNKAGTIMKSSKLLFFLIIFFSSITISYSQQRKIVIDSVNYDQDNPILNGSIDTVITYIHLTDSADAPVAGVGNIRYWVVSDTMITLSILPKLIDYTSTYETIPIIGKMDTLAIPLDSLVLRTGPANVIIIWPALINPTIDIIDSGFAVINLYTYSDIGIQEEPIQKFGSTVFPNPSEGIQLVMFNSKYTQEIQQITVTNTIGQTMSIREFANGESSHGFVLPTENLQSGIYHIHILYKDRKREVVKFIKN